MEGSQNQPTSWFNSDGTVNWEAKKEQKRIPTDTVVVHHTSRDPGMTLEELSNLERQRIYEPFFANGSPDDPYLPAGSPVHSGHMAIIGGKLVESFAIYHFLVRVDGTFEQHMPLWQVGWQAGNWKVNCRSIAICFDCDLEHDKPPSAMVRSVGEIIVYLKYVEKLPIQYLVGHRNVRKGDTACPGEWFYDGGREWILQFASLIADQPLYISVQHPDAVR